MCADIPLEDWLQTGFKLGLENWVHIVGILGFVLSVFNFVMSLWRNRRYITVSLAEVFQKGNFETIRLDICNKSREPISVLKITIITKNGYGNFGTYKKKIVKKENHNERDTFYTDRLPVTIQGLGAISHIYAPDIMDKVIISRDVKTKIKIVIKTSKGRVCKKVYPKRFSNSAKEIEWICNNTDKIVM